jgi:hypothetical protein
MIGFHLRLVTSRRHLEVAERQPLAFNPVDVPSRRLRGVERIYEGVKARVQSFNDGL